MSKAKKIISLLLSVIMIMSVFTIVPFSAGAAEADTAETGASSGTTGDCTWTLDDNGVLTISGNGKMEDYDSFWERDDPVPWGGYSFNTVVIENGVTSIGDEAFKGCTALTSVNIPDSVTSIGGYAFRGCTGLTSVNIPNSVTSIGYDAFRGCTGLTSVNIPNSVTSIGYGAFNGCTGLTSIDIPDSVTSIGDEAFNDCTGLTSVNIPDSVTSIGSSAFNGCTGLTSIKVAEGNTVYDSRNDCNAIIITESNELIYGCMNTVIPDSVTSIDGWAFEDCTGLTSVTIPDSVMSIGGGAFEGCTSLTSIDIPDSVTSIGDSAFNECSGLTSIKVAEGNTVYDSRDNCNALIETESNELIYGCKNTVIPDSVTSIGWAAFFRCAGLTSVTIPDSVTSIGQEAFDGCTGLTSVNIPDSVTSIDDSAFRDCTGLTSINIPDSVTSIGQEAFDGCTGLTSVNIPDSVTWIGLWAFEGCTGLTSIKVAEGNTVYDSRNDCNAIINTESNELIYGCMNTVIPDSVTSIGEDAFYGCTGLTSIDIPDSVTSIGDSAFNGCTGLTSITIGNSVSSISEDALNGCTGLTSIKIAEGNTVYDSRNDCNAIVKTESNELIYGCMNTVIPDSVTSIGEDAFYGCTGLTSVNIPDSVTSIGVRAFEDTAWYNNQPDGLVYAGKVAYRMKGTCPAQVVIKDVTLGIASGAFYGCENLTSITIPDSVTNIGNLAFAECTGLTSITIPDSVKSIGKYAVGYKRYFSGYKPIGGFTIYGYEGSAAENYAEANEFTFVPLKSKTDEATGIILDIPEDTELTVKDITADISSDLPDGCNIMTAYDITLTKDGKAVQPENIVTVKIPCTNENAKVYRLEADGKMTDMNAEYVDGYMVFTTDHFSVYVLAEPEPAVVSVPGDVTGDGKTNVQDCTAILRYVRKLDTLSDDQLKIGDVTGDGKVNVQDVTRILRHVRKIEALY